LITTPLYLGVFPWTRCISIAYYSILDKTSHAPTNDIKSRTQEFCTTRHWAPSLFKAIVVLYFPVLHFVDSMFDPAFCSYPFNPHVCVGSGPLCSISGQRISNRERHGTKTSIEVCIPPTFLLELLMFSDLRYSVFNVLSDSCNAPMFRL